MEMIDPAFTPTPTSARSPKVPDPEAKKSIWSILGPGLVTGASDNDPMHGSAFDSSMFPKYVEALMNSKFAFSNKLLGKDLE